MSQSPIKKKKKQKIFKYLKKKEPIMKYLVGFKKKTFLKRKRGSSKFQKYKSH